MKMAIKVIDMAKDSIVPVEAEIIVLLSIDSAKTTID